MCSSLMVITQVDAKQTTSNLHKGLILGLKTHTHTHNLTKNFTQQKMVSGHQFNLVFAVREIQFDRFVIVKIVNRDV